MELISQSVLVIVLISIIIKSLHKTHLGQMFSAPNII